MESPRAIRLVLARIELLAEHLEGRERAAGLVVERGRARFAEFAPDILHPEHAGGRILVREGAVRLPRGTIREGALTHPDALARALQELRKRGAPKALTAERVVLSIPVVRVAGHTISLPASIRENEEAEAVRLAAERLLPFPVDEAYLDWQEFPSSGASDAPAESAALPLRRFFFVAARKEDVDPYVKAVEAVGLRVLAVEPFSVSVGRGLDARAGVTYAAEVSPDALMAFARDENGNIRFLHHKTLPPLPDSSIGVRDVRERAATVVSEMTSFIRFLRAELPEQSPEVVVDGVIDETLMQELTAFGKTVGAPLKLMHADHGLSRAAARGAAIRAMLPRSEDRFVSLAAVGTEDAYAAWRVGFFLRLSLRVMTVVGMLTALLFAGASAFVFVSERNIKGQVEQRVAADADHPLLQQVEAINASIQRATSLLETPPIPAMLLSDIHGMVAPSVRVDRMTAIASEEGAHVEVAVFAQNVDALVVARDAIVARYAPSTPIDIPPDLFLQQPAGLHFVFSFTPSEEDVDG